MGNTVTKPLDAYDNPTAPSQGLGLNDFYLRQVIGRGAFGQVRIVEHKESQGTYALKTISKSKCTVKQSHINILRERALLEDIDHPFVTPLRFSFQDALNVYVVTDLMAGGDLRFHIKSRRFTENIVRFWVAELACALNYLHTVHGVVHRDVKPENVLMDRRGHVALADFNAAVGVGNGTVYSKTGTPSYMAPEVFGNAGYSYSVDWWSLGIVMYECIYGRRPFRSNSRAAPQEIAADEVAFPVTVDQRITLDCMSAIRGLLHKEPMSRLGCGAQGMTRLKRHPFFATLDWELLEARELCPIFVPDTQAFNNYDVGRLSAADLAASDAPPSRESTMQSDDELDRSCPMLKKLEAEFFDFNYIEYQRFKNYCERYGGIEQKAADRVRAMEAEEPSNTSCLAFVVQVPLENLKLDGRPIVKPKVSTEQRSYSHNACLSAGSRTLSKGPSMRMLKRKGLVSVKSMRRERQCSDAEKEASGLAPVKLANVPDIVPVDKRTWLEMLPSQQALVYRFCVKIMRDHTLMVQAELDISDDGCVAGDYEEDDIESMFQSMYSLTGASLLTMTREAGSGSKHTRAPITSTSLAALNASTHQGAKADDCSIPVVARSAADICGSTRIAAIMNSSSVSLQQSYNKARPGTASNTSSINFGGSGSASLTSSMPRLQPIAACWKLPKRSEQQQQQQRLSVQQPMVEDKDEDDWDTVPEAVDRLRLCAAAAAESGGKENRRPQTAAMAIARNRGIYI